MNKEESIELFQRGKEVWNAWAAEVLARQDDSDQWKAEAQTNFSSHIFGNADFSGFVFPGRAIFSGAQFKGNSWFIESAFEDSANFNNTTFGNEICFIKTNFANEVKFEQAVFHGDAQFGKSIFRKIADFRNTTFKGTANFNNCSFDDMVLYMDATFFGYAMFSKVVCQGQECYFEAHFKEGVTFENSVFSGNVHFRKSKFEDLSLFTHAHFGSYVAFDGFSGAVRFEHATFDGEAWFAKGTFGQVARFDDTTFKKGARFEGCIFEGDVAFSASRFLGYVTFDHVKYQGHVSFQAVEARSAFTMANASFSEVPIFYQATFSEAPRLDNVKIRAKDRQGIVRTGILDVLKGSSDTCARENWQKLKAEGEEAIVRWRTLRRLATQGHDHQRELAFFREEMLSSRWISDKPWQAYFWFGLLYQLFSDFGRSISRPILSWLIWWIMFCVVYVLHNRYSSDMNIPIGCSQEEFLEPWIAALGLSLYRSMPALSGLGDRIGQFEASLFGVGDGCAPIVPSAISFLGVVQSVGAAALLFLVLLAIRNRFRIR